MKQYNDGQKSDQGHLVKEGICPVCNKEDLDYGVLELNGSMAYYPWDCMSCNSSGQEWYNMNFSGQNVKIENT